MVTFVFLCAAVTVMSNVAGAAAPAVPTGLHQTGASNNWVDIAWNAVPNADRYYWSWSADGISGWSDSKNDWNAYPDDTIHQLSAGSTYYVRVRAVNTDDWDNYEYGDWSQPVQVVTAPDSAQMGPLTLAAATTDSLTITWTPCPGATVYYVYDSDTNALLGTTTTPSFVRTGLAPGNAYDTKVVPVRMSDSGYAASTSGRTLSYAHTKPAKPVTPSTANFGITNLFSSINVVYFSATDPSRAANGYEIEVSTLTGKKVFTATSSNYRFQMTGNTAYKYRCRFYATYGNEYIYGDWSGYRYMVNQKASGKRVKKNRIKVNWKKFSGAKNYTVYISTKEKSGYKKVKTLGSKSSSLTIAKCGKSKLKKGKTYYVRIVPMFKIGKSSVKSDIYSVITIR